VNTTSLEAAMTDADLLAEFGIAARFKIHIRCAGCLKASYRVFDVPAVEGAPLTVEELLESPALGRLRFVCEACESPIATISGVTTFRREAA
jgi:hypothetical protein